MSCFHDIRQCERDIRKEISMTAADRVTCPEWALRIYDGLAVLMLAAGIFLVLTAGGAAAPPDAGELERAWTDLAGALFLPAVLLFSIWLGRRRKRREEDEYLRRLVGHAAAVGLLATIVGWASWDMLANSWVRTPSSDQLIGLLIGSSALAYGLARLRGVS
jgi:hypothetical protein